MSAVFLFGLNFDEIFLSYKTYFGGLSSLGSQARTWGVGAFGKACEQV